MPSSGVVGEQWTDRKKHILRYYYQDRNKGSSSSLSSSSSISSSPTNKTTMTTTSSSSSSSINTNIRSNHSTKRGSSTCSSKSGNKKFLVLITNTACNVQTTANQNRVQTILDANGFEYDTLDGANPTNKERRNECFRISGVRGQYPQVFLLEEDYNDADVDGDDTENQSNNNNNNNHITNTRRGSSLTFVGDFETVEGIHDSSNLPDEILEKYPSVVTWDKILQTTKKA